MTKFERVMASIADRWNLHRYPPWKINIVAAVAGAVIALGVISLLGMVAR